MYGNPQQRTQQKGFSKEFHAYSATYAGRENIKEGDKIILPTSAFAKLSSINVEWPLKFRVENSQLKDNGITKVTHCGVLEFSAPEGECYFPPSIMDFMMLNEGSYVKITNVSVPKCTFVKFRPREIAFIELKTSQRVILEHALRMFTCLTEGDIICIPFDDKHYSLEVTELKPAKAVSIVETDCTVEFDAPMGYDAYLKERAAAAVSSKSATGKASSGSSSSSSSASASVGGGAATDISMSSRQLQEGRIDTPPATAETVFKPFSGAGHRLKEDKPKPAMESSGGSGGGGASAPATSAATTATTANQASSSVAAATAFKSKAVGKFGTLNKGGTTAFQGTGHKLN